MSGKLKLDEHLATFDAGNAPELAALVEERAALKQAIKRLGRERKGLPRDDYAAKAALSRTLKARKQDLNQLETRLLAAFETPQPAGDDVYSSLGSSNSN